MKKKILFVINSLNLGGAEKSMVSLLNALDYSRYDVDLLMFRVSGKLIELVPKEVHILPELDVFKFCRQSLCNQLKHPYFLFIRIITSIGLRINRRKHSLHDAQCYWKYAHNLFETLPRQYDVAIAWGQGNPTHYIAENVNAKKKIAVINANYEMVGHNKKFDYPFYEKCDYIVTVSDKLAELIRSVFPDMKRKIKTIYDINNDKLICQMAEQHNPFEDEAVTMKIVTVGRLVVPKGYDLATKACKLLADQGINFKWYIIGEGPERQTIEEDIEQYGIGKYMSLVGEKENPYAYMKNADIYVQTSRSEGYCISLAEARILNVPVISTDFDAAYNQIRDGENGLIVAMNPKAIADAIERLWNDTALREHIVAGLQKEKKGNKEEIEKLYQLIE